MKLQLPCLFSLLLLWSCQQEKINHYSQSELEKYSNLKLDIDGYLPSVNKEIIRLRPSDVEYSDTVEEQFKKLKVLKPAINIKKSLIMKRKNLGQIFEGEDIFLFASDLVHTFQSVLGENGSFKLSDLIKGLEKNAFYSLSTSLPDMSRLFLIYPQQRSSTILEIISPKVGILQTFTDQYFFTHHKQTLYINNKNNTPQSLHKDFKTSFSKLVTSHWNKKIKLAKVDLINPVISSYLDFFEVLLQLPLPLFQEKNANVLCEIRSNYDHLLTGGVTLDPYCLNF